MDEKFSMYVSPLGRREFSVDMAFRAVIKEIGIRITYFSYRERVRHHLNVDLRLTRW